MRNVAVITLNVSAGMMMLVAVGINSSALFLMATAMIATLFVCRIQAWASVRGLRFERLAPPTVSAGELVTVELAVWSDHPLRRPLVSVVDRLPEGLPIADLTPSLPIAPVQKEMVRTQYRFRPLRRGTFRWNTLSVAGWDALGLANTVRTYQTDEAEMTVLPTPIPVDIQVPRPAGWGPLESDFGKSRGAGIEPRGVREYAPGDSLRFVHWRSTARTGRLLVKEFETGSHGQAAFLLQRTAGTDLKTSDRSSLDRACGHVAFIAGELMRQGTEVVLPLQMRGRPTGSIHVRCRAVLTALARISADQPRTLGEDLLACRSELLPGTTVYACLSVADDTLPHAVASLYGKGIQVVALLYDPGEFTSRRARKAIESPIDPAYMAKLRQAGVKPIVMPSGGHA